jgi:hypothetical protein
MSETAYKVVAYNPNGPIDPEWNNAINRELFKAEYRGDVRTFGGNSAVLIREFNKARV